MKKLFFLAILLFCALNLLQSQTILLQENFSTASGTTPPAGWTIQTVTGDPLVDLWHFDNPGRRIPNSPITDPFACFDSDKLSDNGQPEEVYLTSPAFDASTVDDIILEFDQYFLGGYGGGCTIEVFNGTSWISVFTNNVTITNPLHSTFNITTIVQNITNAQVRYKWTGNYSWYWIIDNIKVKTQIVTANQFTEQPSIALIGVSNSSAAWGDYDNDGDLDILLTGQSGGGSGISKIYRNDGYNNFTEQTGISLPGVYYGSVAWGDYDNDGDLDILLTGTTNGSSTGTISKIYENNGYNSFTEKTSIILTGVYWGSVAWGDYDNDGYLDILLTGQSSSGMISKVYHNNGENNFTEQTGIVLTRVIWSSVAWGDYDNDGDLDILLTGATPMNISKIYRNNGDNSFTEQTGIVLTGISRSSVAWGDYDNDGDLDILLTGSNTSKIYRNNGNNTFSEQTGITLYGVDESSAGWSDYDNDGDLDILLTGSGVSKIYRNNGDNSFTEQTGIALTGIMQGSVAWGDYDNDGDLDIFLTGSNTSKIYKNNNTLKNITPTLPSNLNAVVNCQQIQFTWDKSTDVQTPQAGLNYNIVISSTPGGCNIVSPMSNAANGNRKVVQTGNCSKINSFSLNSRLPVGSYYWGVQAIDNTYAGSSFATGTFSITDAQATNLSFSDITPQTINITWTRGNKQKCVVFMKQTNTGVPAVTNNYSYTANPVFGLGTDAGNSWYCVYNGTGENVSVKGLNGSTTYNIMVLEYSGEAGQETFLSCSNLTNPLTCNTQEQFTGQTGLMFTGVYNSSIAWGDYDNDNYLDVLLTGSGVSKIYHNNGNSSFSEQIGIALTGVNNSSAAWGDYDSDGNLDVLLTGWSGSESDYISRIYRNNGDNSFTEQTGIALTGVNNGSVAWGDYDNDGDLDILLTGSGISKIYRNNGDNSFSDQTGIVLTGLSSGSVAWGDYDNDGDLDILMTGAINLNQYISRIYRNNGDNSFSEQTGIALTGVNNSSVAWGDYDNDGDLDILLTGNYNDYQNISKIYRNNGDNSFTEQTGIALTGVNNGSVAWGDYDNDGNMDILITGADAGWNGISKIYRNNGNNTFTEQTGISLTGVTQSSAAWGDYDNDGDLDVLLTGQSGSGISKIYKNNSPIKNTIPSAPGNGTAMVNHQQIQFNWDKSADLQTPQNGLNYNLVVGSTPGSCDIISPMSNIANGFRKVVRIGNLSKINSYTFNSSLPAGTYYWGIQAIDNVYAGSLFATGAFTITDIQASNLKFTDITTGSMKITWDRGNEQKCAVFMKQGSAGLPAITNYTNYIADTVFGNGTLAGDGWYCIYNGNGQNVSVTGLRASNVYKIMVIEYSGETGQEIYLSFSNSTNPQTCYTQEQFIKQTGIGITISPSTSSVVCGDYDNDGDLDILLTGYSSSRISKIYCNNGDNTFTDQSGIALTGVTDGSMAWGDYDNDGDLDILLTGLEGSTFISKIYNNNGGNSFTEQTGIVLPGVWQSSVAWGDYDNDGDLDFILTGQTGSIYSDCISKIYRNNGDGSFTEQSEITLTNVTGSSVAWGDHDNDGDFDILLIGYTGYEYISRIYRNNGYNSFTEQTDILLTGLGYGSAAWGDYDNDGDLDIILTGYNGSIRHSKIYRNNGDNSFTEQTGISLPGVMNGSASWSDYDNDGDLDILLTGNSDLTYVSKIYQNNGDNSFTEQPGIVIEGVSGNSLAWGDYDNDGDLDILSIGNPNIIYSNNSFKENSAPAVPSDIVAYLSDKELILSWDKATDAETPQLSLSYNLRVGTTPGGCEILSPMSLPDGRHKIVTIGNVEHDTKWTIDLSQHFPLPENIYYSVQAIDNGFMASAWSSEKSEISDFVADFLPYTVCQKTEVQFQDKSYSIQYPVISYLWKFTEGTSVTTSSLQNPIYTFQTSGTKQVELTITNSTGVSTVRTKSITVLPAPLADFSALPVCQGTLTNIVNTTQINTTKITGWSWNFGDGTPNSTEKDPGTHSYNIGTFNLSLTVHADNGCMLTTTKEVFIAELPSKLLSISGNTNFCANENTSLSADYKDYYTYQWMANGALIPDSTRDNLYPKSSATYSAAITNTLANNCTIQSDPVVLTVKSSPPVLIITGPQGKVFCLNDTASRLSAPLISGLTYNWMVNGNLAFSGSNTFVPQQSGTYTLSVSNADNCSQLSSNSIPDILINQVPAVPNVTSPTPIFCSGTSFSMETPYSNELAYQWLDNGAVVSGAVQNKYSPAISGKYSVRITKNGCSNTSLSTDVTILPTPFSPAIVANNPTTFCQGDSVILSATNNTGYTYQWKRDGGAVGTNSSQFVAKSSGNYNLVVSNANGCSVSSTNSVDIIVNPVPSAGNISLSGPPTFCEGGSITLSVPSATGYFYNWRNEYGLISGANTNSYAAGTSGTYQLDISNPSGCTVKTSTVNITVKTSPYKPVLESVNYEAGTCPGENTIRLSSTQTVAEYQYQWYKDGLPLLNKTLSNLDLTELGNYKLEVSLGGCMVESDVFNINFPGAPEKPFIYAQGPTVWYLACSNTKASKYIWYCNDKLIEGADKYYYVANRKMGDYQVSIANELGCYTRSDVVTIPTGATGINDIDPFEGLIIYPNPTTGMFTIEMDNDLFGELLITIITEQGKEIRTIKSEKTTEYFFTQIDLSGQSKGLYFINLAIDKYFATRKIVIE